MKTNKSFALMAALNFFGGAGMVHPIFDVPQLAMGRSFFYNYHKQNQRRHRREMRRTVFANRHIRAK